MHAHDVIYSISGQLTLHTLAVNYKWAVNYMMNANRLFVEQKAVLRSDVGRENFNFSIVLIEVYV